MRNRYPSTCHACHSSVPVKGGEITGPPWLLTCDACFDTPLQAWREPKWADPSIKLYGYQEIGARWLAGRRSGLLADEMGVGKTVQAIAALPKNPAVVVVCPLIAKGVWVKHARWRTDIEPLILSGRGCLKRWPKKGEAYVINYDILADSLPIIGQDQPVYVILDEADYAKNPHAKRTRRVAALCAHARNSGGASWLLTGTPLDSRPPDLWSLLRVGDLRRESWPTWKEFKATFGGSKGRFGTEWSGNVDSADCAHRLPRVMLRRVKADVLPDLPEKVFSTITVPLPEDTRHYLVEAMRHLYSLNADIEEAIAEAVRTRQGAAFEELARACKHLATAKIPTLLALVERYEAEEKPVLVWSRHRAPVEAFEARPGWLVIHGGVSDARRKTAEDRFQAGELKGMALTIKAGGVALTLTRASHAIFVDRHWNPSRNEQAIDRIHRMDQKDTCFITDLVADHALDERLFELLTEKKDTIDKSIGAAVARQET